MRGTWEEVGTAVTTWRLATSGTFSFRKIQARAWVVFRIMETLRIWWEGVKWG